jgi:hypothetical protein
MKKKIFLVCSIFIFYHAACIAVNVIPSLFDIQTWYIDTESTFGNKSRIFLSKREKGGIHFELHDYRPEDKVKQKLTLLDKNVYETESETDMLYRNKVFYSYGSAGFYAIYANPFKIKVYRNPSQPLEEKQEIDRSLAKYSSDEIQVISSVSDLASEERKAYEKLRVKADNKEGR